SNTRWVKPSWPRTEIATQTGRALRPSVSPRACCHLHRYGYSMTAPEGSQRSSFVALAFRKSIERVAEQVGDIGRRLAGAVRPPRINGLPDPLIVFVAHHDEAGFAVAR